MKTKPIVNWQGERQPARQPAKKAATRKCVMAWLVSVVALCGGVQGAEFGLQRAEFAKYYRQITGKDAPEGMVRFAVDPKVSASGRDAYRIVSGGSCSRATTLGHIVRE